MLKELLLALALQVPTGAPDPSALYAPVLRELRSHLAGHELVLDEWILSGSPADPRPDRNSHSRERVDRWKREGLILDSCSATRATPRCVSPSGKQIHPSQTRAIIRLGAPSLLGDGQAQVVGVWVARSSRGTTYSREMRFTVRQDANGAWKVVSSEMLSLT